MKKFKATQKYVTNHQFVFHCCQQRCHKFIFLSLQWNETRTKWSLKLPSKTSNPAYFWALERKQFHKETHWGSFESYILLTWILPRLRKLLAKNEILHIDHVQGHNWKHLTLVSYVGTTETMTITRAPPPSGGKQVSLVRSHFSCELISKPHNNKFVAALESRKIHFQLYNQSPKKTCKSYLCIFTMGSTLSIFLWWLLRWISMVIVIMVMVTVVVTVQ